jgi:hypothetical protein
MPSRELEYRNLILNQRVEVSSPFVSPAVWKACGGAVGPLEGIPVYGGLDLSAVSDLTALVLIGWRAGKWHVQPTFWLPTEGLAEKAIAERVPYDLWQAKGYLQLTPGKTVSERVKLCRRGVKLDHRMGIVASQRIVDQHRHEIGVGWRLRTDVASCAMARTSRALRNVPNAGLRFSAIPSKSSPSIVGIFGICKGTSLLNIHCARSAYSGALSSRQQSATTSSRTTATSTNSGSARS